MKVSYSISYGGTDGIVSASVTFRLADITVDDLPFTQTFSINYTHQVQGPDLQIILGFSQLLLKSMPKPFVSFA